MKLSAWAVPLVACIFLDGCADAGRTRAENLDSDRQRCSDYGYREGTDAFASCMERHDEKRERAEERADERKARMRALALKRSGDERYPICNAATPNVELDVEGFWYAEGCRAR
jgi:hypothetical protein